MRVCKPAVVGNAPFTVLAMMTERTVNIAAGVPLRASPRSSLVLQHQQFAGAHALAVHVVAELSRLALTKKMVVVATLTHLLETRGEAFLSSGVGAWQRGVEALVVDVDVAEALLHCLPGCDIDAFTGWASFADSSPGVGSN